MIETVQGRYFATKDAMDQVVAWLAATVATEKYTIVTSGEQDGQFALTIWFADKEVNMIAMDQACESLYLEAPTGSPPEPEPEA